MHEPTSTPEKPKSRLNTWLVIFLTAPLPVLIVGYLFYRYATAQTDFKRLTQQMVERQNTVLANDAVSVARELTHLLENVARDVQTLSLVRPTPENYLRFYLSHVSEVTQVDPRDESVSRVPLPIYDEMAYLSPDGSEVFRFKNGKPHTPLRSARECTPSKLCDSKALKAAVEGQVGQTHFGKLMRWYSPSTATRQSEEGSIPVYYRSSNGIYLLSIDYRYFRSLLSLPTFPYERKRDLQQSYQNGNYIYFVDEDTDIILHPKPWHVTGIDPLTGQRMPPMRNDEDEGKRPIRLNAYESGRLKEYFDRLLKRSFLTRSVDIFRGSNLGGVQRILSAAPVLLSKGQFQKTGIYGHVILGCNMDYFEEPKEQYVPYY